jgi:hypothetical protein
VAKVAKVSFPHVAYGGEENGKPMILDTMIHGGGEKAL